MSEKGPIYGVPLIETLPLGGMKQAMPNRADLEDVAKRSERTVAGYEVLLDRYRKYVTVTHRLLTELESLKRYADGHHSGEDSCVWLHSLTVDIPSRIEQATSEAESDLTPTDQNVL